MLIICTVIFIAVFAVMFYSIWKHRKSRGAKAANFHESVTVEVIWTIVPFVIVILMALPATKVLVAQKDTTNADLTIKATGYLWKWGYDYLSGEGEGLGFVSTLCAAKVPDDKMDDFVARVNACPGVTHNYLREHAYNIWFTLISPSRDATQATLDALTEATGIAILNLPATRLYKIRVDFRMDN